MELFRRTYAEVNLDTIANNFRWIKSQFPDSTFCCPMVKANAYGHGDVFVAKSLEKAGAKVLGVCLIEEGLLLRNFGIKTEILVFRGFDREGAKKILQYRMTPVVSQWEQLSWLDEEASGPVDIHIKFDTGMNRLGFAVSEAQKTLDFIQKSKNLKVQGVLTHLAVGEDAAQEDGFSEKQLGQFSEVVAVYEKINPIFHTLNSAAILNKINCIKNNLKSPKYLMSRNWGLRPGLAIYGVNPMAAKDSSLQTAMVLKSTASTFREIKKGERVSYNGLWVAQRDSTIAVVPIGYADGFHRLLSNKAQVLFAGVRVPVIGNICMDFLMLDITDVIEQKSLSKSKLNELKESEVVLIGKTFSGDEITAKELALHAQTIPWEVFTSVGERVPRIFTGQIAAALNQEVDSR